jgi:hypothetical protein
MFIRYRSCNYSFYWVIFHISFNAFSLFISHRLFFVTIRLACFRSLLCNLLTATCLSVAYALYVFNVTCILDFILRFPMHL